MGIDELSPAVEFQESVSRLIGVYLPSGNCSIKTIAGRLGIHRSTLNKRLIRTNQSYLRLLQAARIQRASHLCSTDQPLREIARQLGFADLSVFSRWFTATFGHPATVWRKTRVIGVTPRHDSRAQGSQGDTLYM